MRHLQSGAAVALMQALVGCSSSMAEEPVTITLKDYSIEVSHDSSPPGGADKGGAIAPAADTVLTVQVAAGAAGTTELEAQVAPVPSPDANDAQVEELEARIDELEARLAELEAASAQEVPPEGDAISRTGGVNVGIDESVEQALGFGGPVEIEGVVHGDAVAMWSDVIVRDGGVVKGNAVSFGGEVIVEEGGTVLGDRIALWGDEDGLSQASLSTADLDPAHLSMGSLVGTTTSALSSSVREATRQLAMLLAFAAAGVLMVGIWPDHIRRVSRLVSRRPIWYGIAGAILTATFGLGAVLLAMTLVGAPLSLLLVALLAVAWLLGFVGFCQAAGERLPFTHDYGNWATFLVGAGLVALVSHIPWVGTLVLVLIGFTSVGSALMSRFGNRRDLDEI